MPIKFRCPHCRQFLGISRAKAGEVSDCPMCGKRLRVPELDGTVKPLPTPELNLDDSSLVDALGELAGIGNGDDDPTPMHAGAENVSLDVKKSVPVPEPITLEPLAPARPVRVSGARAVSARGQTSLETAMSVSDEEATIDVPDVELRTVTAARPTRKRRLKRDVWNVRSLLEKMAIAVAFLVAGFGLAMLLSPTSSGEIDEARASTDPAEPVGAANDSAADRPGAEPPIAVTGRITYITEAGDSRADDGATILALPEKRRGTAKLDVTGFRVGASDADKTIATASLRAIGGDVTTANGQGEYTLRLDQSGRYRLLVISRHQPRSWETGIDEDVQELLAGFFIHPTALLGKLAFDVRDLEYRGQGTASRDVAFHRQ